MKVAPIQINYLGFSGSMGTKCMDYIIADKFLIPEHNKKFFDEKLLLINPSAICFDDDLKDFKNEVEITRKSQGLPEKGFIYSCFNQNYNITPEEFNIWMNLLKKVDKSYLWLRGTNKYAQSNLLREAKLRGVSSDKIIFTNHLPYKEHLARHNLVDLFLDTFNYNAGSTAIITLIMKVPLLTLCGESYHARMSASILNSLGLNELITYNKLDYEEKAFKLATNKKEFKLLKTRLDRILKDPKVFNTLNFTKELERKYMEVYNNFQN